MLKPDLTNEQLQILTESIAEQWFDIPYRGKIVFYHRLRTTAGLCSLITDEIRINPKMEDYGYDTLIGIIKHELCHYQINHTYKNARPHGKEFQRLLRRVGGRLYAPTPTNLYNHFYRCQNCGYLYYRKQRVDIQKYECQCGGSLVEIPKPKTRAIHQRRSKPAKPNKSKQA